MPTVGNDHLSEEADYPSASPGLPVEPPPPSVVEPAGLYATREVVACEHRLEVVGDERVHEAVRVANLVLRLVRLHYSEVSLGALGRLVGRKVLLPRKSDVTKEHKYITHVFL